MKTSELKLLATQELLTKLEDSRHELLNLRFQMITGQLTDTSRLKKMKRDIARYETLIRERELDAANREGAK